MLLVVGLIAMTIWLVALSNLVLAPAWIHILCLLGMAAIIAHWYLPRTRQTAATIRDNPHRQRAASPLFRRLRLRLRRAERPRDYRRH